MNLEDYLQLRDGLHTQLTQNPTTRLALTVAWLDPMVVLSDVDRLQNQDLSDYYYDGDDLGAALTVARDCFPGIYAQAIGKIRAGESDLQAVNFICHAITDQTGLPVDEYDVPYAFGYGIPLPYYGLEIDNPDFVEHHPLETHLLGLLGASLDKTESTTRIEISEDLWDIAHILQWSLWPTKDDPIHRDMMWALAYCFSNSGNSSVDTSDEIACEFEPLHWTQDDLEFAMQIAEEAQEIMTHAINGLKIVQTNPDVQNILQQKVAEVTQHLTLIKQKGLRLREHINRDEPNPFRLRWHDLCRCPDRDPATDPELLQLRLDVA